MSQCEAILNYLRTGNVIEPLYAINKMGCYRLAARIKDLRKKGHIIQTIKVKYTTKEGKKKSYACYRLIEEAKNESVPAVPSAEHAG